jgi:hypothetical protein
MGRNAAARGEDAFGGYHAAQVFRRSFNAGEHDFLTLLGAHHGFLRIKNDATTSRARPGGKAGADLFRLFR